MRGIDDRLEGVVFGDRTVIEKVRGSLWRVRCVCGEELCLRGDLLKRGMNRCRHSEATAPSRFWAKVDKSSGCWVWTASRIPDGYGSFKAADKVTRLAHIWAWESENGAVPAGLQLDHLCRNRACVNPGHLEPVTASENVSRGLRGRLRQRRAS